MHAVIELHAERVYIYSMDFYGDELGIFQLVKLAALNLKKKKDALF